MKKLIVVLLAVCLLTVGVWYYVRKPLKTANTDRLLPADTLLTVECLDLTERIEQFRSTPLGKKISGIDVVAVMEKLEAPPKMIDSYRNFESSLKNALQTPLFEEIFGQRVVLAWIPNKEALIEFEDPFNLLEQMVLITQPRHRVELVEYVGKVLSRDITFTFEAYKDYEIRRYEPEPDRPIYYTLVKGLLIASAGRGTIIRCLDQLDVPEGSLASVENYKKLRKEKADEVKTFVYGNIAGFFDILKAQLKDDAEFQRAVALFNGLKNFGLTSSSNERLQEHLRVLFDAQELDPRNVPLYTRAPEIHQTLAWTPEKPLLYYSVNSLDLDVKLQRDLADPALREAFVDGFMKMTTMHPDKLIDSLGHQFGLALVDVRGGEFLPSAKLALFIELNETGPMNRFLRSVTGNFGVELNLLQKNGIDIHTMALPLAGDFQPTYAFYRGFCLVASNPQLIFDIIEGGENAPNLLNDADFQAVLAGRPDAVNSLSYVKFDRMMDAIRSLLEWSRRMAAFQDAQSAEKLNILTDEVIFPLLEGLKMYQSVGSFTQLKEDELEAYSYTSVASEKSK